MVVKPHPVAMIQTPGVYISYMPGFWPGWLLFSSLYVIDIAWDRVFYEIYRHEHEGELPCICIKHEDFSCYMCFISRRPRTYCVIKNINRKELYDFYYTAITLTTGYKLLYSVCVFVGILCRWSIPRYRTVHVQCHMYNVKTHSMHTVILSMQMILRVGFSSITRSPLLRSGNLGPRHTPARRHRLNRKLEVSVKYNWWLCKECCGCSTDLSESVWPLTLVAGYL